MCECLCAVLSPLRFPYSKPIYQEAGVVRSFLCWLSFVVKSDLNRIRERPRHLLSANNSKSSQDVFTDLNLQFLMSIQVKSVFNVSGTHAELICLLRTLHASAGALVRWLGENIILECDGLCVKS